MRHRSQERVVDWILTGPSAKAWLQRIGRYRELRILGKSRDKYVPGSIRGHRSYGTGFYVSIQ